MGNDRIKSVSTKTGVHLKIALPVTQKVKPIDTEQWGKISNDQLMVDVQGQIVHVQNEDIQALESFLPKNTYQEALQIFQIATLSLDHPLLEFLNASIAPSLESVGADDSAKMPQEQHVVNAQKVQQNDEKKPTKNSVSENMATNRYEFSNLPEKVGMHLKLKKKLRSPDQS